MSVNNKEADEEIRPAPTLWSGTKEMFTGSWLNVLLIAVPITFMSEFLGWNDSITFLFSLLAIAPLAERLGFVTEQLAIHTNDSIGALLNVSFGNATELIVAISALTKGLYRVVQLTLLGSVLSNMLLVLGCAFFFGGIKYSVQYFNTVTSQVNMTLLMLSVMGLLFPTVMMLSQTESTSGELGLSRCCAVVLLLLYCLYLFFQLKTHRHIYEERPQSEIMAALSRTTSLSNMSANGVHAKLSRKALEELKREDSDDGSSDVETGPASPMLVSCFTHANIRFRTFHTIFCVNLLIFAYFLQMNKYEKRSEVYQPMMGNEKMPRENETSGNPTRNTSTATHDMMIREETSDVDIDDEDDDDDDEEDLLGFGPALFWLAVITTLISVLSDYLVQSIQSAAEEWHISGIFLSAVVIPIIGNAAEHAGAIIFAMKNKLDLALGIAIGSSTQIALMVLPILVIVGWIANKPMTLNFQSFEATTLFLTVITVTFAIKDGTSNWLVGAVLIGAYVMLSAGFWTHYDENLT